MDQQVQEKANFVFGVRVGSCPSFECFGQLLKLIVSGGEKRPGIELSDCCFDPATGIETSSLFSIMVNCEERRTSTGTRTITVSGTVDNHQGRVKAFTLHLYMWQGRHDPGCMPGNSCLSSWSGILDIPCVGRQPQQLSDMVFDILLHQDASSPTRAISGGGRGCFLFRTDHI